VKTGRYILIAIAIGIVIFFWAHTAKKIDYMKKSLEFESIIKENLLKMGLSERDLIETYNEEKREGRLKWIYFTKRLRVPANFSFEKPRELIEPGINSKGGKIFSSEISRDGKNLVLKIGIKKIITHIVSFERSPAIARIAIIIDDFGFNKMAMDEFMALDFPLSFSVLPYLKYSKMAAELAHRSGKEVMLHLPLQGTKEEFNKNVITVSMDESEIVKRIESGLKSIPYAIGVNNHMGSIVTQETEIMKIILEKIKEKGLFFVDSLTSERSVGYKMARNMGIRTGRRDVFLDVVNYEDTGYIRHQLQELVKVAKKKGEAIGIGHNRIWTARVLKEELPKLKAENIELVFASQIVR